MDYRTKLIDGTLLKITPMDLFFKKRILSKDKETEAEGNMPNKFGPRNAVIVAAHILHFRSFTILNSHYQQLSDHILPFSEDRGTCRLART